MVMHIRCPELGLKRQVTPAAPQVNEARFYAEHSQTE